MLMLRCLVTKHMVSLSLVTDLWCGLVTVVLHSETGVGGGTKSYKMLISTYGCFNNRLLTSYAKTVGLLLWCPTPPGADHESVHPERLHGNATLQRGALPGPRTLREEALGRRRLPPPRPNALPDPASAPRRPAHREWRPLAGRHQRVRPQLRLHVLQRGAVQVGPGC